MRRATVDRSITGRAPRAIAAAIAVLLAGPALPSRAEIPADGVKIGVMTDMSGQFADFSGPGSVAAAELAVAEFGGKIDGKPVTILAFDHQNKPDIASAATRQWYDQGVSMIIDYPVSSTALAAQEIARDKKRIVIFSSAGAPVLSGKACSPYGFQWMFDTYGLSNGLPEPLAKRGVDSYYFITADYVAGQAVEADFRAALDRAGLKALGGVKYPLGSLDMSSFVVPALSSPAKGLVIAGAGADMTNVMKAAVNFGLKESGKTIVAPATFITDVKGLGLAAAQGLIYVDSFYWDRDDRTRGFAKRFYEKRKAMPTSAQAGVYSGVRHYLKAVDAAKSIDADLVAAKMREMPVEDDAIHSGLIRPDGRVAHDMLLVQVKTPAESQADWDLLKIIAEVPIEKAVKPLADSDCPLVKK